MILIWLRHRWIPDPSHRHSSTGRSKIKSRYCMISLLTVGTTITLRWLVVLEPVLLDNYFMFDLSSDARWIPEDSSTQTKTTKVYKYALKDDSMLHQKLSTLHKAMPEKCWFSWYLETRMELSKNSCRNKCQFSIDKCSQNLTELSLII